MGAQPKASRASDPSEGRTNFFAGALAFQPVDLGSLLNDAGELVTRHTTREEAFIFTAANCRNEIVSISQMQTVTTMCSILRAQKAREDDIMQHAPNSSASMKRNMRQVRPPIVSSCDVGNARNAHTTSIAA